MKRLYNKILNEVLSVYDFDSWDDSEQTFKTDITLNLVAKPFIHYKTKDDLKKGIQIFSSTFIRSVYLVDEDHSFWTENFIDEIYVNGRRSPISLITENVNGDYYITGCTIDEYDPGEYEVIIKNINIENKICTKMFEGLETLISVPSIKIFRIKNKNWKDRIKDYGNGYRNIEIDYDNELCSMFNGCCNLRFVDKFEWEENIQVNAKWMFAGCSSLDSETREIWNIKWKETPVIEQTKILWQFGMY